MWVVSPAPNYRLGYQPREGASPSSLFGGILVHDSLQQCIQEDEKHGVELRLMVTLKNEHRWTGSGIISVAKAFCESL